MDLSLLYDADIYHYVLTTDFVNTVCNVRDLKFRFGYRICRNCFWFCRDGLESCNNHTENCYQNAPAVIQMPSPDKIEYKFSFILTLNLFSYPSLDMMQQLTNHQHA